jgi:hypothetical protein
VFVLQVETGEMKWLVAGAAQWTVTGCASRATLHACCCYCAATSLLSWQQLVSAGSGVTL